MSSWVLYDDPDAHALRPFTWLRPASDLRLGAETTEARWARLLGAASISVACRRTLVPLKKGRIDWRLAASNQGSGSSPGSRDAGYEIWVSDLVIPDRSLIQAFETVGPDQAVRAEEGLVGFRRGPRIDRLLRDAAATLPSPMPEAGLRDSLAAIARLEGPEIATRRLTSLADLIRFQEPLLAEDLARLLAATPTPAAVRGAEGSLGDGYAYEPRAVRLGEGCVVDHGAVLDAREGPVILAPGCRVHPHSWLQGPLFADRDCRFLGGRVGGGSTLGPVCRVRGELEASVLLGYTNKSHDGFVGHSYLGEWVNLGALTTTSDLKNNYSFVVLDREAQQTPTGLRKVGVFIGDHAKTRIGCLLNCGTIVGVGANVIGDPDVAGKWVPDFAWGHGEGMQEYAVNKFLGTAETVFGRRGIAWTEAIADALTEAFEATRPTRRFLERSGDPSAGV